MLFVVCAPGLEPVASSELRELGSQGRTLSGGIELDGQLPEAMRLNLWLRTASRVLVRLGEPFRATSFAELVRKASSLPWGKLVRKDMRAAFRVTCRKSRLYHSDAVAERLHAALEARVGFPVSVADSGEDEAPAAEDVQLFLARIERDVCTVSADSSGALLHQRGWRGPQAKAPLRETLAAALLLGAGFRADQPFCDPMCGSGTLAIEAALIALGRAPGLNRRFAFQRWPGFSARQWEHLVSDARKRERSVVARIEASDQDAGAVRAARENALQADVDVDIVQRPLADLPGDAGQGLIACNPPYGVRIAADLRRVYADLGAAARRRAAWRVALIAARPDAAAASGLRFSPLLRTKNGGIPIEMLVSE
jgi:putative N6-adenine-specific DNA methylase